MRTGKSGQIGTTFLATFLYNYNKYFLNSDNVNCRYRYTHRPVPDPENFAPPAENRSVDDKKKGRQIFRFQTFYKANRVQKNGDFRMIFSSENSAACRRRLRDFFIFIFLFLFLFFYINFSYQFS